jgi:hypothetical protein
VSNTKLPIYDVFVVQQLGTKWWDESQRIRKRRFTEHLDGTCLVYFFSNFPEGPSTDLLRIYKWKKDDFDNHRDSQCSISAISPPSQNNGEKHD